MKSNKESERKKEKLKESVSILYNLGSGVKLGGKEE